MSSSSTGTKVNQKIDSLPPAVAGNIPHVSETKEQLKEEVKEVKQKSLQGLRSLAAGGFGGVCAVIVGHPFDLVKVRLQTAERGVYKSAIDVVRKSIAKDGLGKGLYAGVSAPLVGVTPMCKLRFGREDQVANISQSRSHSGVTMLAKISFADFPPFTTINFLWRKFPLQDFSQRFL